MQLAQDCLQVQWDSACGYTPANRGIIVETLNREIIPCAASAETNGRPCCHFIYSTIRRHWTVGLFKDNQCYYYDPLRSGEPSRTELDILNQYFPNKRISIINGPK